MYEGTCEFLNSRAWRHKPTSTCVCLDWQVLVLSAANGEEQLDIEYRTSKQDNETSTGKIQHDPA